MRKNLKRTLIALALLATVMLAGVSPATAETGLTVTVTNGTLTITGTEGTDTVSINHHGDGGTVFRVKVTDAGGGVTQFLPSDVTANIIVDTKGGDDEIKIGDENPTLVPKSLTIRSGTGSDSVIVRDTEVVQDLILDGEGTTHLVRTEIGDDLIGTSGPGYMRTLLTNSTVDDLFQIRATNGGQIMVKSQGSAAGRVRITGGNKSDRVELYTNSFGRRPNIDLAGGNDVLFLFTDNAWTGNASYSLGAGDDQVLIDDQPEDGVLVAHRLGRMKLRLGADDDIAFIRAPLSIAGTIVDAQGGFDSLKADGLENHASNQASYRNFEDIESGGPELAVQLDLSSAGDLQIESTQALDYFNIENVDAGYGVYWRATGSAEDLYEFVDGVTRNITIEVETPFIFLGLHGHETTTAANVTIKTMASEPVSITVTEANIGGNLKVVSATDLNMDVTDSQVGGTFDVRANAGPLKLGLLRSTFNRTRIVGSQDADEIVMANGLDLGTAPNINLRNGNDKVRTVDFSWSGRLTLIAGSGDDDIIMDGQGAPFGRMKVSMGSGTDVLQITSLADNGAASSLRGDSGEDTFRYLTEPTAASIKTFETEEPTV